MPIGIENIIFNYWMIGILFLYTVAMLPIIKKSFKENHAYKWNNLVLVCIIWLIIIFLSIPYDNMFIINHPWNFFFIVFTGSYIFVVAIVALFPFNDDDKSKDEKHALLYEYKRKVFHLLAVIYLICYLFGFLFNYLVYSIPSVFLITDEFFRTIYFLTFLQDQYTMGISFLIFLFVGSLPVQLNAEFLESHWPEINFPVKKILRDTNREVEKSDFGCHLHILSTFALGSIIFYIFAPSKYLATHLIFAMILISIFGDMFAALIGKTVGKHHWSFFEDKTIEGTAGGFGISFVLGTLFLGPIGGLIGSIIFVMTDIFLPKITSLSDNMLNPLLLTIAFIILAQFETMISPFLGIKLIAFNAVNVPELSYIVTQSFWGTFPCILMGMVGSALIALLILLKYRKNQIYFLFTGKKKRSRENTNENEK